MLLLDTTFDWTKLQEDGMQLVIDFGTKLITAVIILLIGNWLIKRLLRLMDRTFANRKVDETLRPFIRSFTNATLKILLVIVAISRLGVEMTSIVAILASAALAIGLALQGSLSNLAGGVVLIITKPFKKGEVIEAQGKIGKVEETSLLLTTLKSLDNKTIFIPNGPLAAGTIVNFTREDLRRVDMVFGVSYDDSIEKTKATLKKILDANPLCLKEPEPIIALEELADSSVNFATKVWCKTEDYWDVYFQIHEEVKKTFDQQEITIPFPQRVIHQG